MRGLVPRPGIHGRGDSPQEWRAGSQPGTRQDGRGSLRPSPRPPPPFPRLPSLTLSMTTGWLAMISVGLHGRAGADLPSRRACSSNQRLAGRQAGGPGPPRLQTRWHPSTPSTQPTRARQAFKRAGPAASHRSHLGQIDAGRRGPAGQRAGPPGAGQPMEAAGKNCRAPQGRLQRVRVTSSLRA